MEERLVRVERLLDSGALVQMLESLEALRNEVQSLRGEIEVQANTIAQLKARQRELYLGLDDRLLKVERAGSALVDATTLPADAETPPAEVAEPEPEPDTLADADAPEPSSEVDFVVANPVPVETLPTSETDEDAPAAMVPDSSGAAGTGPEDEADPLAVATAIDPVREQQDYQNAFNLLKGGRYRDAAKAFREFLASYLGGEFVDNARYWLGETYYVDRQFEAALQEFQELIVHYPQSPKFTHAMLKVGYIHHELGRPEQARQTLLELVERHPDSTAAGLARKRLKRLQSG
ncbi:MAG: tol-pal system protein YbgF [Rhodococcus sp.]|nr:tol-pal system protein YbgF [Rhodococcus sp. (in: high G+C Gram-positive bacteria)]